MEQRILGGTGRDVSVVGLGTWQLGADWGDVSDDDALGVLEAAAESGVTFRTPGSTSARGAASSGCEAWQAGN